MNAALPIGLERRLQKPSRWVNLLIPIASGVVALAIVAVVLLISNHDPIAAFRSIIDAAFSSSSALSATLVSTTPLLFTGLAAAVAFRMKAWNIGGEGQLYVGAVCAAGVGIALGDQGLAVALPAMVVAGIVGGALFAAVPGLLRAHLHTNEILTSLMLNYVAGLLLDYLILDSTSYWRDLTSPTAMVYPQGRQVPAAAFWPGFTGGGLVVPLGFVIGLVCATALYVLIGHTRFGFKLRVIADNPQAGRYAGIRNRRMFVTVMLISGALAGLAGASQVGDFSHLLDANGLQQAQYGYTGIVVAALARYNPLGVVVSALFLGAITNAGLNLQSATFPQSLTGVIEGVILFCVLGGELLTRYHVRIGRGNSVRRRRVTPPPDSAPVAVNREAPTIAGGGR